MLIKKKNVKQYESRMTKQVARNDSPCIADKTNMNSLVWKYFFVLGGFIHKRRHADDVIPHETGTPENTPEGAASGKFKVSSNKF